MARSLRGRLGVCAVLGAGVLAALAGCGPAPPPPTVVNLTLSATLDVNPSKTGQAAPVQIVVYQLGSASTFSGAEFFQLFNKDAATLGPDLLKRDQFILAPGETKTATLMPTDAVKTLGVFAAYQSFQSVTWRGTLDIPPHQTTSISVTATKAGVTVAAGKPGS